MVVLDFFFFFKQKTAYEMRISDWSSDVCSSDLDSRVLVQRAHRCDARADRAAIDQHGATAALRQPTAELRAVQREIVAEDVEQIGRASCGKECVSACRSRWSPYH